MASSTLLLTKPSLTVPLTTIFTPPPSCSSSWTYEAEFYNSVHGGLLMQNVLTAEFDTACWPKSFSNNGREPSMMLYSPGACPSGYTSPVLQVGGSITTAVCCLTGFSYSTILTTVNNFGTSSVIFEGCISSLSSGTTTKVPGRSGDNDLNSTTIKGPLTMWAQPITVEFQSSDASLFPSSTTSASASGSAGGAAAGPTTLVAIQTASPSPSPSSSPSNTALSTGATAGIAVGAVAIFALLAGLLAFFVYRRRQARRGSEHGPLMYPLHQGGAGGKGEKPYADHAGVYRPMDEPPGELMGNPMLEPRGELAAEPSAAGRPIRKQGGLHEMAG